MIRKLLSMAFAALTTASMAADLPNTKGPAYFAAPVPIFTWTGFYVGLNAGGAWSNGRSVTPAGNFLRPDFTDATLLPFISNPFGNKNNGNFTGGAQAGYNWHSGALVFGVEADINFMSNNNNKGFVRGGVPVTVFGLGNPPYTVTWTGNNNNNVFGTARARLGYAVDRALFFVTGGVAFRGNDHSSSVGFTDVIGIKSATFADGGNNKNNNIGWALGGGIEYAFTNNWSVKAEYIHAGFSNKNRVLVDPVTPGGAGYSFSSKENGNLNIARVGINYKF
jgi:outer membrane immunogenic protein